MAMLLSTLLVTIVVSTQSAYGLECLVVDPLVDYYGFVFNPDWTYCSYDPIQGTQHYLSSGISDDNDEVSNYKAVFEDIRAGGHSRAKVPHLCFDQIYRLNSRMPDTVSRCLCDTPKCNVQSNYPWWLTTFGEDNLALNASITYRQYQHLRYKTSLRRYKFN